MRKVFPEFRLGCGIVVSHVPAGCLPACQTDPILYDALIRRFQTPAEREKEGREKGYSRVLEVDLLRGEARLTQLGRGADGGGGGPSEAVPVIDENGAASVAVPAPAAQDQDAFIREYAAGAGTTVGPGPIPGPESREQGRDRWNDFLRRRFVLGRDEDFDYRPVDENDDYDALERREEEDQWFNDEDPAWAGEEGGGGGGGGLGAHDRKLEGETGIQDF